MFRKFCRLEMDQGVPQASTIGRFRISLEKAGHLEALLTEINSQLSQSNVALQEGRVAIVDGSSGDSMDVIQENQAMLPEEVIILPQKNQGAAVATNAGGERAKYDWVRFLDGDDIVCRESTAAMHCAALKENAKFIIGSFGYFSQEQDLIPPRLM